MARWLAAPAPEATSNGTHPQQEGQRCHHHRAETLFGGFLCGIAD